VTMRAIIAAPLLFGVLIFCAMRGPGSTGAAEIIAQRRGAAAAPDVPRGLRLKADLATPAFVLFPPHDSVGVLVAVPGRRRLRGSKRRCESVFRIPSDAYSDGLYRIAQPAPSVTAI
jgi:hypothetical protein